MRKAKLIAIFNFISSLMMVYELNRFLRMNKKSLASVADRFVDLFDFEHDIAITKLRIILVSNKLKLEVFFDFFKNVALNLLQINLAVNHGKPTMVVLDIIIIELDVSLLFRGASFGDLRVFRLTELGLAAGVAEGDAGFVGQGDLLFVG